MTASHDLELDKGKCVGRLPLQSFSRFSGNAAFFRSAIALRQKPLRVSRPQTELRWSESQDPGTLEISSFVLPEGSHPAGTWRIPLLLHPRLSGCPRNGSFAPSWKKRVGAKKVSRSARKHSTLTNLSWCCTLPKSHGSWIRIFISS